MLVLGERAHATGMIARRLVLPDVQAFPRFAVAEHRGDVLVGAPCGDAENRDVVHLIDAETGAVELVIPNPSGIPCERFGDSIASDGAEIFVASPFAEVGDPPRSAGAVLVFSGVTGAFERELPAPDSVPAGA